MQQIPPNARKLLKPAGRSSELLVGWTCALISVTFAALLVYLIYVVGWRNPRQYGSHDLIKSQTLALFAILLFIAIGFSVLASRLLPKNKSRQRLMSPFVLRAWGVFFLLGSAVLVADCVANRRWHQLPHLWEILASSISMAVAAFVLAKKSQRDDTAT